MTSWASRLHEESFGIKKRIKTVSKFKGNQRWLGTAEFHCFAKRLKLKGFSVMLNIHFCRSSGYPHPWDSDEWIWLSKCQAVCRKSLELKELLRECHFQLEVPWFGNVTQWKFGMSVLENNIVSKAFNTRNRRETSAKSPTSRSAENVSCCSRS